MQFRRALNRPPLPKWPRFPGASGPHKGLDAKALESVGFPIPWQVVCLCSSVEAPFEAFVACRTTMDTHDLLDLLDIIEVKNSWAHAAQLNVTGH